MPKVDREKAVSHRRTLTLNSDLAELERLRAFVEKSCVTANVPDETCFHVAVVLEELFVNSVTHGKCNPPEGAICVTIRIENERLLLTYSDNGIPFDLVGVPEPDLAADVGRRPIGGLGVHLVRCLVGDIRYERCDGRNCLCLATPVKTASEPAREEGSAHADCNGNRPG